MIKDFDLKLKTERSCKYVAGYDECGRGAICGHFVAAVCVPNDDFVESAINDSKKLTEAKRFELANIIKENSSFYKIVEYSNQEIDVIGIQTINISAFETLYEFVPFKSTLHLVDGNIMSSSPWCTSIIKGDSTSFAIACASILAKTYRDNMMIELSSQYPGYNLEKNKGYGEDYISKIKELGIPSEIHRFSYKIKLNDDQIKLY